MNLFHFVFINLFSGLDIRQYISKRTCISVSMSIAFLTLIIGFLLGKSTSDRHHAIKDNRRQNELAHRSSENDIEKVENALILVAKSKLLTNFKEYYDNQPNDVNTKLKQNFTNCMDATSVNIYQANLEDFLSNLIREEFVSFITCADSLKKFLQDLQP